MKLEHPGSEIPKGVQKVIEKAKDLASQAETKLDDEMYAKPPPLPKPKKVAKPRPGGKPNSKGQLFSK